jgi:DNA mismatch repair protein MSH5
MSMAEVRPQVADDTFSMLALAQGARLYNLCRPQMTPENVIRIQQGRSV